MVEEKNDDALSRAFNIPGAREGSVKNNESDILLLKRRIKALELRVLDLEGS
jgi:hypothetical protein